MEGILPQDNLAAKANDGAKLAVPKAIPGVNAIKGAKAGGAKGALLLKFPLENQNAFKGKISFQPVKVIPPGKEQLADLVTVTKSLTAKGPTTVYENDGTASSTVPDIANLIKYSILEDKVEMFLPIAYQVNDQLSYDATSSMGLGGGALLSAAENTSQVGASIRKFIASGGSTSDALSAVSNASSADLARSVLSRLGPAVGLNRQVSAALLQQTPNPNNRAIFTGVANREFSFQFKLVPTSAAEAKSIRDIILFFRTHAYPEGISAGKVPIAYNFPNLFKIKIKYNGKDVGTRLKMCYLRNISTTYNPTASVYYADGEPVETDLTLSFVEYIPLVRQDITGLGVSDVTDKADARFMDNGGGF